MRYRIWFTLAATALLAVGGGYFYHQSQVTTTTVQQAKASVDKLYRNSTHTLPATDLEQADVSAAKRVLQDAAKQPLDAQQKKQLQQAQKDVTNAKQMLAVVGATHEPIAPTKDYRKTATAALSAYAALQSTKPVFTQVYQQPVTTLNSAATAVSALQELQTSPKVTPKAITTAESAVQAVTKGADTAFAAEAETVVTAAKQKLDPATPSDTETTPDASEETASSSSSSAANTATSATAPATTTTSSDVATTSSTSASVASATSSDQ
ncbi:MAG: hypothetical protein LKJ69_06395 [Lactobacillus sp.]|jgi:hypothetical protein|nr:hypothetical protein [Lactobacillus sp.]MCI2033018.1 hypothetical protein [Lactobacillus sp.]